LQGGFAIHRRVDFPDGHKTFSWLHPDGKPSKNGEISSTDKLYGLERINGQTTAILVEGEKAADALQAAVGDYAIVLATVCGAPSVPNTAVLASVADSFTRLFLWPDHDAKGIKQMEDIAAAVQGPELRRVVWHDAPVRGDAADYVKAHTREELFALLKAASHWHQEPQQEHPAPGTENETNAPAERVIRQVSPDIFSAADLAGMNLPEQRWAVRDVLPEGLSMLAAKSKLGKSWLALGLGIAVAAGGRALGQIPVEPGEVLYLALEDHKRRLRERLGHLLGDSMAPAQLFIATAWPKLDDGGIAKLNAWLREHPAARLVVIDVWKRVRQTRQRGANLYDEDYEHLVELKTLADRHSVSILVLHHTRKANAEDVFDEINGTSGVAGALDAMLILHRARGEADAQLWVTGRDLEEAHKALRFDAGSWTLLGEAADVLRSKERRAVLEIVTPVTGGVTPAEVAMALGKPANNVRHLMFKMLTDGELRRLSNSKYIPGVTPNGGNRGSRGNAGNGRQEGALPRYPVTPDGGLEPVRSAEADSRRTGEQTDVPFAEAR
jgi:hypothetical protein